MGDSIKLGTVKLKTALVTEFIQGKITVAGEKGSAGAAPHGTRRQPTGP